MSSLRSGLSTFLLAGVVTAGSLLLAAPAAHAADTPLRDLAEAKGKVMGTAVTGSKLTGTYGEIAGREFNSLTPGNAMKWGSVEPSRGSHDWAEADRIVDFAEAHGQQVRGHTLLWHQQNPDWLTSGSWTRDQLGAIVQDHIATEVGRYKGRIAAWDVVNEPFNEDGTYRPTLFHTTLGQDYIAQALTGARAADPGAKLYINDYNVEGVNAKSTALYNLVKSLKERGIPIDGVGLQAHLIVGQVPSTLQQNIQRFADLGDRRLAAAREDVEVQRHYLHAIVAGRLAKGMDHVAQPELGNAGPLERLDCAGPRGLLDDRPVQLEEQGAAAGADRRARGHRAPDRCEEEQHQDQDEPVLDAYQEPPHLASELHRLSRHRIALVEG